LKGDLKQLQHQLQIQFHDSVLLKQAFTHASYVNEHRFNQHQDNERLEFLGDAVLELTVSEYLYKLLPDRPEGELTKLRQNLDAVFLQMQQRSCCSLLLRFFLGAAASLTE